MISLCRKYRYPSTVKVNMGFKLIGILLFDTWDSLIGARHGRFTTVLEYVGVSDVSYCKGHGL
jgi:hypothetical protein